MLAKKKMHFRAWKEQEKSAFEKQLDNYSYVIIGDLNELPAKAERKFRKVLKDAGCYTKVLNSKVALMALHEKGIKELDSYLSGPTLFVLSNENPFKLNKLIKQNSLSTFAKEGMLAPDEIYVEEGDTGIPPGPALTDFKVAKVNTQIRNGKIYVAKKTLVASKGDTIDSKVANLLTKLKIKPRKIILDVRTVLDRKANLLYFKDLLDINIEKLTNQIKDAYQRAHYLAMGKNYVAKDTIKPLLIKGYRGAKAVALAGNILNKETAKEVLVKARRIANSLSKKL